jgi:hypothetical protein
MHTSWRRSLLAMAVLAGCSAGAPWGENPAVAADSAGREPAVTAKAAAESAPAGTLQPFNALAGGPGVSFGNGPAVPPAMFAALEDLSKKSIAGSQPTSSQPSPTPKKPAAAGVDPGKTQQAVTAGHAQQRKPAPEQQSALRGRRPGGPAAKIEALRERLQQGPAALRRRGFRRAA